MSAMAHAVFEDTELEISFRAARLGFFLGYVRASRRFGLRRRFFDHSDRRIHTVDARASRHRAPTLNRTRSQSTS
jgi:hypothetical protein